MRKNLGRIMIILSSVILICCIGVFIYWGMDREKSVGAVKKIEDTYVTKPDSKKNPKKSDTVEFKGLQIDWAGLKAENGNIVAWIDIPGRNISYPVLQGSDDDYYLHHTVHNEYSVYGSIFLCSLNKPDFSDSHSVIYGHNMNDGSMFAGLNKYSDKAVFDGSSVIDIYMPGKVYEYRIFSCGQNTVSGDGFVLSNKLGSKAYKTQLETLKSASSYDTGTKLTATKPFITLITCNPWHNYGSRTTVHAILENTFAVKDTSVSEHQEKGKEEQ